MFYTPPEKGGIIPPKSLKEQLDGMRRKQEAITAIDKQQYQDMLKGLDTGGLGALRKKHEAELAGMKTAYAKSMGLGERKPKNQLAPESKNDKDFWEGFRKGLGLKDGEEIGQGHPPGRRAGIRWAGMLSAGRDSRRRMGDASAGDRQAGR